MTLLGIVGPALLVVLAIRRWFDEVPWRIAVLFLVLTLAFLHGAVFTSKLPVPVDEVARGYPFRGVFGEVQVRNALTNDTVKLFLPWMQVAREELAAFRAPLWNRYSFSGYPLLGNGEAAPFSPLFLATLFVPLPKQIVAMAGLKIFLALLFTWLFARRQGASEAASCFAAVGFSLSVFQTVYLYYSTTAVTALMPAAMYALFLVQEKPSRRGVVLVAVVVATLMANGHPESVLHIATAAAILMAVDLVLETDRRAWLRRFRAPVAGALSGLALSAPTWVPVAQQVLLSTRLADLRRFAVYAPMPFTGAWAMILPNGFGNPVRGNWSWYINYSNTASSYVGLIVLALFPAVLFSRRLTIRDRLWCGAAAVLWMTAMGWTVVARLLHAVPPFSISANDKLRFAVLFIVLIVVARYLDRLDRTWIAAGTGAAVIALALYVYRDKLSLVRGIDLVPAACLTGFLAVIVVPRLRRHVAVAAAIAITVELFALNVWFNALVDGRYYRPEVPMIEALRRAAPREPFRIAGFDWMFLPNASVQYGLEDIRGSDPMSFDAYTETLKQVTVDDRRMDLDLLENADHPLLDFLNVRFLMAEPGERFGERWSRIYSGPDGELFENTRVRPRFFSERAAVTIEQATPLRFVLRTEASQKALIESSQPDAPGWRVEVNGRAVRTIRRNGFFQSFWVPRGSAKVEVVYRPLAYYGSLPVALAAVAWLIFSGGAGVLTGTSEASPSRSRAETSE